MGICASSKPLSADKEIETHMLQHKQTDKFVKKLLLLGSGSSGKSTLFKQLKCIFNEWGLDASEYQESIHVIRQNCVLSILKLLQKSQELYQLNPKRFGKCLIDLTNNTLIQHIQLILKYRHESFEMLDNISWDEMEQLGDAINYIWTIDNVPGIRATFNERGTKFAFPDNMDYFFDRSKQLFIEDYYPSHEDVLKVRIRTTGMTERTFEIKETFFNIFDVGGQRNERKKWIHSFEGVTAVIFVAALNHFDAVCFEDEKQNAMHESIELFSSIFHSKWFKKTAMILFLNKDDLFRSKLRDEININYCFSAASGWKGVEYKGAIYKKQHNPNHNQSFWEHCYKEQIEFISDAFLSVRNNGIFKKKEIFIHITTATDRDNVKKVFWDTQNIVIRKNLHSGGFY